MKKRKRHRSNPRVLIRDSDGRASLVGLNYEDLQTILTAAALHQWSQMQDELIKTNKDWREHQLRLINLCTERLRAAISNTFPKSDRAPTKEERKRAVEMSRQARKFLQALVEAACSS